MKAQENLMIIIKLKNIVKIIKIIKKIWKLIQKVLLV